MSRSKPDNISVPSGGREAWPDVPEARRAIMRANRRRDTAPELALRSALHRAGMRFRVDFPIRPEGHRAIRPDVVFPRRKVAIYLDGCFWHGCPVHGTVARSNADYWRNKIADNQARDRRVTTALEQDGWTVLRFWTHQEPQEIVRLVADTVAAASDQRPSR